ncbi:MAG: tRNA (adenosine(37)-N6)-threonylcarbamoyltransferase complex dimerization subunit type 1 TsaB [Ginsengibacter sp.]|jgi:tRNA threonylcarbamoyladenosine biosynthesis protein TsaB
MILNIHTATEKAIINLCDGEEVLGTLYNNDSKQHASFLHQAIHDLLISQSVSLSQLQAIGVNHGPGSYTGIRVGLATAKGLCYALKIPLITFNTLEILANSSIHEVNNNDKKALYCPMIDARRMEVFTAIYNSELQEILKPQAMVLSDGSFDEFGNSQPIYFSGNGAHKFEELHIQSNYYFDNAVEISTQSICHISEQKNLINEFTDLIHSEAYYLKEVHFLQRKS